MLTLRPRPLTAERFAPFGDVIEAAGPPGMAMNAGRFQRFDDLCGLETDTEGRVAVSIARCRTPTALPYRCDTIERHPLGSQAFIPLAPCRFVVVVAPPAPLVAAADLHAFVTNGRQGINYRRGTWHMPLIAFAEGQDFLIIDRAGPGPNCDEHTLDEPVLVAEIG